MALRSDASSASPLAPLILSQLNYLLSHSPLPFKVHQIWSGCRSLSYSDRFTLLVPYCLDYVKWDIIYNAQYPMAAPDVIFPLEEDDFHPLELIAGQHEIGKSKSSLHDWNIKDPTKLLSLVHELRNLYMIYQRKRIGDLDDERLKFEMNTVLSREGIEVSIVSGNDKPDEVKFAVPLLDIDLNTLVHGCPWKNQQKIYLQVIFQVSKRYTSTPLAPRVKLVSSSELKALLSIEDVKLPVWVDGMCIAEYLPALEDNLKMQVMEAVASIGARRRFIEALAPIFGRPLEADPVFCRRATVLSVCGSFTFMVHFFLPSQFPKQQPVLVLQSSQHFDAQGAPVTYPSLTSYPWSPRWDPSQMVDRIFEFLVDECLNFKSYCNEALQQQ